jgi:hypothetical protein
MTPAEADEELLVRYRLDLLDKLLESKASVEQMTAVTAELASIKKLLVAVLMAIVVASIGFGFAALQIAGTHA